MHEFPPFNHFLSILTLCLATAAASSAMPMPALTLPYKAIPVITGTGARALTLDLILPENDTNTATGATLRPLIIYIHGGGWINTPPWFRISIGEQNDLVPAAPPPPDIIARLLPAIQKNNIAYAQVSYRFAGANGNTIETCVTDCLDALRYLALNAPAYHLDPNRFVIFGESAGGHLALMAALADSSAFPGDIDGAAFRVIGALALCPQTTLADRSAWGATDYVAGAGIYEKLLGGTPETTRALAEKLSPLNWLNKNSPRLLLIHGENDTVINIKNSLFMQQKADAVSADLTLLRVPGATHAFLGPRNPLDVLRAHANIVADNLIALARQ